MWARILSFDGEFTWTTRDILRLFGIPEGFHLVILQMFVRSSVANDFLDIQWDNLAIDRSPPTGGTGGDGQLIIERFLTIFTGAANSPVGISSIGGIHVRDQITFDPNAGLFNISIEYAFAAGELDFRSELAHDQGRISQVSVQRSAGSPYYQVGPINQIGGQQPDA